jgi:hypothetical protein
VVAAEGVAPRQPVDDHRALLREEGPRLPDHLLIGGKHPVRVEHAFRRAGGPGGEQDLRDGVGPESGEGRLDRGAGLAGEQGGERLGPFPAPG